MNAKGNKMSKNVRNYIAAYKAEAVKLWREIGPKKAKEGFGIPVGTLGCWLKAAKEGSIDTGKGTQTPETALTQATIIRGLQTKNKALKKEMAKISEENKILEDAVSFFAARRLKSERGNG
jgi:transposase